jgi:DNA-binding NtrC family response regulator
MNDTTPSRPLLLSIDDEADMREIVMTVADHCGFRTCGADAPMAIKEALDREPVAIVLDLIMPGMDGIEVIWELARRKSQAFLIILSGFDPRIISAAKTIAAKTQLKLVACLNKPVELDQLREHFSAIMMAYEKARVVAQTQATGRTSTAA